MNRRSPKALVWQALMGLGIEVHAKRNPLRFVKTMGIRTVLDIGANEGQFALEVRNLLPGAQIYSFEPVSEPYSNLCRTFVKDPGFMPVQLALGSATGRSELEVNEFSPSSSFLPITDSVRRHYPHAIRTIKRAVDISTLDSWSQGHSLSSNILVKIDVQGYEDHVIAGGLQTISRASVIIVEVSFVPLYRDQPLYDQIYDMLRQLGFKSAGMIYNAVDRESGTILQADAIFVPKSYSIANS